MFHPRRAAAMTAFFLAKEDDGRMNDIKLAKLQYLAERKALIDLGAPIADDRAVSLEHGPCLSATLSLTNDRNEDEFWDAHIGFDLYTVAPEHENTVRLIAPIDVAKWLSGAEIEVLESIWTTFGHLDKKAIKRWCHRELAEYTEVGHGGQRWIDRKSLLVAGGLSPEHAEELDDDIRYRSRFAAIFAAEPVGRA